MILIPLGWNSRIFNGSLWKILCKRIRHNLILSRTLTFLGSEYTFFSVTKRGGTPLWKALRKYVSINFLNVSPVTEYIYTLKTKLVKYCNRYLNDEEHDVVYHNNQNIWEGTHKKLFVSYFLHYEEYSKFCYTLTTWQIKIWTGIAILTKTYMPPPQITVYNVLQAWECPWPWTNALSWSVGIICKGMLISVPSLMCIGYAIFKTFFSYNHPLTNCICFGRLTYRLTFANQEEGGLKYIH